MVATRMKRRAPRRSINDILFDTVNYTLLAVLFLVIVFPLLNVIANSFSSVEAVMTGKTGIFPVDFTTESYRLAFNNQQVWRGYANSLLITISGTRH